MKLISSRFVIIFMVLNLLVLVAGGVSLAVYDVEQLPEVTVLSSEELLPNMTARQQKSPVQMASFDGRPLFHQNRKPYLVKKAIPIKKQVVKRVTPLTAYQLKGIVYINGGKSFVLLVNKNSGKKYKLKVGDGFDGWTVKSIVKASVDLTRGTEVAQLKLIKSIQNRR